MMGGALLEWIGMEFTSQIEDIEACFSVDLGDLTDASIKTLRAYSEPDGKSVTIQYIDLEGKSEEITSAAANSELWNLLPYDKKVDAVFSANEVYESYDFTGITEGYFLLCGLTSADTEYDFERKNVDTWNTYIIGILDTDDKMLYRIAIEEGLVK